MIAPHHRLLPRWQVVATLFLACTLSSSWAEQKEAAPAPVKLLTIGNSFADNATQYLPEFAKAAGENLEIFRANLGGHSLKQHSDYLMAFEADATDAKGSPYTMVNDAGEKVKVSLKQVLESEKWDYVTIQQLSSASFKPESYEPYADTLIDYIHKYAPQAEILIHQTWSYREDHPLFSKGDGFNSKQMFDKLQEAYAQLAANYKLRTIPVGEAFQLARSTAKWSFQYPDPNFDYKNPAVDSLPKQTGSLMVGWIWGKNRKTGAKEFQLDAIHANQAGRYLGAAVFFEVLFKDDVEDVNFTPQGMSAEEAADLRHIAHDAVTTAISRNPKPAAEQPTAQNTQS